MRPLQREDRKFLWPSRRMRPLRVSFYYCVAFAFCFFVLPEYQPVKISNPLLWFVCCLVPLTAIVVHYCYHHPPLRTPKFK